MAGSCSEAAAAPRRTDNDAFLAIKAAGYIDQHSVDIRLAIAVTAFTNVFNRINGTAIGLPAREPQEAATALWREPTVTLQ